MLLAAPVSQKMNLEGKIFQLSTAGAGRVLCQPGNTDPRERVIVREMLGYPCPDIHMADVSVVLSIIC